MHCCFTESVELFSVFAEEESLRLEFAIFNLDQKNEDTVALLLFSSFCDEGVSRVSLVFSAVFSALLVPS